MRLRGLMYNPAAVLNPEEPALIGESLGAIETALRGLRTEMGLVLRPVWLPSDSVRQNLMALDGLLEVGADLANAGRIASGGLQSIAEALAARDAAGPERPAVGMSEALFAGLAGGRAHFQQAAPLLGEAAGEVAVLEKASLWSPLARYLPTLGYYLRLGEKALEAATSAPALLGQSGPANYLLLAQNNDELRATGGFITGIGLLTLEQGRIEQLVIKDSYDFDQFTVEHPWPPEPMTRYMDIDQWVTRDGNWSPDFPTAAQDVESLYYLENSTELSGVVAFDMLALQALVRAVGPLYLEDYQDHINGDNVVQKARQYWNPPLPEGKTLQEWYEEQGWKDIKEEWWLRRKDFMGVLAQAVLSKLQGDTQPDRLSALIWAVKRAIDEKHILLFFHEPAVRELLTVMEMDGRLDPATQGDYLLVVDTNMGYNKVNLNVSRRIEYEVILGQDGPPRVNLSITYQNRSPAQPACVQKPRIEDTYALMAQDCYWNYLRVYVPPEVELLSTEGVTETEVLRGEQGQTVFATFLLVPAAESKTVRFTYELPKWDGREYRLLVQKQPGTVADPLQVKVALPEGASVLSSEPKPSDQQQGVLSFALNLQTDRELTLELR